MKYGALTEDDTVAEGDEFLEDDCETWTPVHHAWHAVTYSKKVLRPMRRLKACAAADGKGEKG